MKFVLVNGRTPRTQSLCALCCESIGESYLRDIVTQLPYCNHKCYVDHCKVPVLALQYHAMAIMIAPNASKYLLQIGLSSMRSCSGGGRNGRKHK